MSDVCHSDPPCPLYNMFVSASVTSFENPEADYGVVWVERTYLSRQTTVVQLTWSIKVFVQLIPQHESLLYRGRGRGDGMEAGGQF